MTCYRMAEDQGVGNIAESVTEEIVRIKDGESNLEASWNMFVLV